MHKLPLLVTLIYHQTTMRPLLFLSNAFINTFGITQPAPEAEARAGKVILAMLIGVVVVIATVAWVLRSALLH